MTPLDVAFLIFTVILFLGWMFWAVDKFRHATDSQKPRLMMAYTLVLVLGGILGVVFWAELMT